jgi:hypothetical protein
MIKSVPKKNQNKSSDGRKTLLERINQLAQPKNRRFDLSTNDHIRPNRVKPISVQDIFGNIEDTSYENFYKPKKPEMSTNDTRFRKLIHLFSEVHERKPATIQSVKVLIEANASLQYDTEHWGSKNVPNTEYEDQPDILNDSSYSKTDLYLIEACA